ncbi:MAG: co-chaperone GroES [Patescibacteria group bacterium]|nr:co-chaperone GroES [Patescibacteria group bacterium]
MKLKPLGDRVIVRQLESQDETKFGIVLPSSAKEKPQEGEVLAIGEGKYLAGKLVPLSVKVGDKILFSKYGGDEIKIDGKELKILQESDILAIIQ